MLRPAENSDSLSQNTYTFFIGAPKSYPVLRNFLLADTGTRGQIKPARRWKTESKIIIGVFKGKWSPGKGKNSSSGELIWQTFSWLLAPTIFHVTVTASLFHRFFFTDQREIPTAPFELNALQFFIIATLRCKSFVVSFTESVHRARE